MSYKEPKVTVNCIICGKPRTINRGNLVRKDYSGKCSSCHRKEIIQRKSLLALEQRKARPRGDGYMVIHLPADHWCVPMSDYNSRRNTHKILYHRLVMAEYLGRLLTSDEIVHHINGIKDDNRIDNLMLTTKQKHGLSYQDGYSQGFKDAANMRDKALEKQIKLLQWQLREALQTRFNT